MAVTTKISKFGNSKGIRLPKALLQQSQLSENVELIAKPGKIIIRTIRPKDQEKFKDFSKLSNDFDDKDWTW
jgi:antitoxin MazE